MSLSTQCSCKPFRPSFALEDSRYEFDERTRKVRLAYEIGPASAFHAGINRISSQLSR